MSKTLKLKFNTDMYVNGDLVFEAGKTYDVPVDSGSADRWIKRGAEVVEVKEKVVDNSTESNTKTKPTSSKPLKGTKKPEEDL